MAVTLHDVAKLAGVSIKTVSEVVNKTSRTTPTTRERVEAAITKLGYQPNLSARRLRSGRTGVIGLAIPELSKSGHFSELSSMVVAAAEDRGLRVLIEQTGGLRQQEIAALHSPWRSMIDGLLLNALSLTAEDVAGLVPTFPIVLLGERRIFGPFDHVTIRNEDAAFALARHLVGLGRRRILVVGGGTSPSDSAALRLSGFARGLRESGIELDGDLILQVLDWDRESGIRAVHEALDQGLVFDAVFGMNDALALGAIRALHDRGLRMPDDIAVVGFDDIADARFSYPSLTTIDPDRRSIAEDALDLLIQRISDKDGPARQPIYREKDFRLVERESTRG